MRGGGMVLWFCRGVVGLEVAVAVEMSVEVSAIPEKASCWEAGTFGLASSRCDFLLPPAMVVSYAVQDLQDSERELASNLVA